MNSSNRALQNRPPDVSVLMPTYNQDSFLLRAVESLKAQTLSNWELLIVDDGSTDTTANLLHNLQSDPRVRTWRLPHNKGFGYALNLCLAAAQAPLISYLPSDDLFLPNHLEALKQILDSQEGACLAFSGIRFHARRIARGQIPHFPLQLVQVMHRRSPERWAERSEIVSDDLDILGWNRLRTQGSFVGSDQVSCEWVDHPQQHHKIVRENMGGGLNPYRSYYRVKEPLRFQSSVGSYTDEIQQYGRFRERRDTPRAADGLKILLVGELAFNPDRILALEERGHQLFGLWMSHPWWLNTVGPLPFGHVTEVDRSNWRNEVKRIKPDIIYSLLNWQAVPFVHEVLKADLGIPFVWHFKEGPWMCLEKGTWPQMVDLHTQTDAQIYTSPELQDWFETILPGCSDHGRTMVLDGDLPKKEWFEGKFTPRLSDVDGEFHTVVPGRPIGLSPDLLKSLPEQRIHIHFYGDLQHRDWAPWVDESRRVAPHHFHLHRHVGPADWVSELSRFDAGWLHFLRSDNGGDLRAAFWDDLNLPARLTTLMAAGLPLLQYDNAGSIVATQSLAQRLGIGLFCKNMEQLGEQARNHPLMARTRANIHEHRKLFTFDAHADELIRFFRRIIAERSGLPLEKEELRPAALQR